MSGKQYTKFWSIIVLVIGILISAAIAYYIAMEHAMEVVYVARERITNAPATIPMEQFSLSRALGIGIPIFVIGSLLSVAFAVLYDAILSHCRK